VTSHRYYRHTNYQRCSRGTQHDCRTEEAPFAVLVLNGAVVANLIPFSGRGASPHTPPDASVMELGASDVRFVDSVIECVLDIASLFSKGRKSFWLANVEAMKISIITSACVSDRRCDSSSGDVL
jgi:hypothetical protein